MRSKLVMTALLALLAAPGIAQTLAVEGVVSPVWVERGGSRVPLAVGMQLNDRDRIVTGPGSRALLRMADPLSFFVALRQDKPLPVAPVDPKQLKQWATE